MRPLASIFLLSASLAVAGCGSSSSSDTSSAPTPTPVAAAAAASTPASTPDASATTDTSTTEASSKTPVCKKVSVPPSKSTKVAKPTGKLDTSKTNLVTLATSCGTIVVKLDPKAHPITANAVAWLAKKGYYDRTIFHRVVPGFVIQGGDPLGTGTGGPSWTLTEAPPASQTYPEGTFAMAKGGDQPSGTIGSQFFIMTGGSLDPSYAVAGKVLSGMPVAHAIEALGAGQGSDGPPSQTVELISAKFSAK